jgi:hypothetical protein
MLSFVVCCAQLMDVVRSSKAIHPAYSIISAGTLGKDSAKLAAAGSEGSGVSM